MLQDLKLSTMAAQCSQLALKAAKEGLSHEAFLHELARLECEQRSQRRRRMRGPPPLRRGQPVEVPVDEQVTRARPSVAKNPSSSSRKRYAGVLSNH